MSATFPERTFPRRLAVVLSHPTQYYSPWFRWIAQHTDLHLHVFYLWKFGVEATRDPLFRTTFKWDVDLLSGYSSEFVPNVSRAPGAEHFWGFRNPQLPERLAAWRPDAVLLFGYAWATHLHVIAWARLHRMPLIFRGDSHLIGRSKPAWHRAFALRLLYRQFAAVTFTGIANRTYFETFRVLPQKLFLAPHAVDRDLFEPARLETMTAAVQLRAKLGISPSTRIVLFAGKFVAAKQPRPLLAAFLALRPENAAIVFVGDGAEKAELEADAQAAPPGTVHFLPFANQTEMPARYLLADLFVLPSRGLYETWGLAINEAMHMGVPTLVSDLVGCQRDLVTDGETGWVFSATNPGTLQQKLAVALAVLDNPVEHARIRRNVVTRIANYTYAHTTKGLLDALASVPLHTSA